VAPVTRMIYLYDIRLIAILSMVAATGKQATPRSWPGQVTGLILACPDTDRDPEERQKTHLDADPLLKG
jgi:hypothetical protein